MKTSSISSIRRRWRKGRRWRSSYAFGLAVQYGVPLLMVGALVGIFHLSTGHFMMVAGLSLILPMFLCSPCTYEARRHPQHWIYLTRQTLLFGVWVSLITTLILV